MLDLLSSDGTPKYKAPICGITHKSVKKGESPIHRSVGYGCNRRNGDKAPDKLGSEFLGANFPGRGTF